MCQAVWRSPLLPLVSPVSDTDNASSNLPSIGSGARFKADLLAYLRAYKQAKLGDLINQLKRYNFNTIRAALIASTPSKQNLHSLDSMTEPIWGWPGLRNILKVIPSSSSIQPQITIQVSSVASLGTGDKWFKSTFLKALATESKDARPKPNFSLVFPTANEIRRSLDGYDSGGSIHMKTQSVAQAKQLTYLKPMLCHWAGENGSRVIDLSSNPSIPIREAGRRRAAPHIKTYIRFSDDSMTKIDWAIMTSANLSTQAWGAATNGAGEVRICSYEIGIVVWPALWDDGLEGSVEMIPVFKNDRPPVDEADLGTGGGSTSKAKIGLRMPFDLPLVRYADHEEPWCATAPDNEPDLMGRVWAGFAH